eukprot:2794544-Amphidinium_carterae.1
MYNGKAAMPTSITRKTFRSARTPLPDIAVNSKGPSRAKLSRYFGALATRHVRGHKTNDIFFIPR